MAKLHKEWVDDNGMPHPSRFEAELADVRIDIDRLLLDDKKGIKATANNNEGGTEICEDDVSDFIIANATDLNILLNTYLKLAKKNAPKVEE